MKTLTGFLISLLAITACATAQTLSEYKIARTISLQGDGFWDYLALDESTGRLFVSHGTVVRVVDAGSGKTIGTIADLNGVHGIALAPEFNKGFITNGRDSTVPAFDLTTYASLDRIKVTGVAPAGMLTVTFTNQNIL